MDGAPIRQQFRNLIERHMLIPVPETPAVDFGSRGELRESIGHTGRQE